MCCNRCISLTCVVHFDAITATVRTLNMSKPLKPYLYLTFVFYSQAKVPTNGKKLVLYMMEIGAKIREMVLVHTVDPTLKRKANLQKNTLVDGRVI